jgi:glutamate/tyrosine decarboxylase-like PLP-dependent enzyme
MTVLQARPDTDDTMAALEAAATAARAYLESLDDSAVRLADADAAAARFGGGLPDEGDGALAALDELIRNGFDAATRSSGPRMFHFVTGGGTPAALAADWLTSVLDQNSFSWVASPLGSRLEHVVIGWLRELFGLPATYGGVLTTGATMANVTALACARQWWGERHGVDIAQTGFAGLPAVPVFAGGYLHASAEKALAMVGIGRGAPKILAADPVGRIDLEGVERALRALDGAPSILMATVGEVNAGDSDPVDEMADLADRYGAWLHVDGAFGLFARCSPRSAAKAAGVERAHSVIADGHKWLNVPYDTGFAFVRDASLLGRVFTMSAAYLPDPDDPRPNFGYLGPEASRRARAIPVWATLRAYGRSGYRALVERHLDLALGLAARVDAAPDLELLAAPTLNIVAFRYHPAGIDDEAELDRLNERLGEALIADGRVYAGTTRYGGRVAFRPAIASWRITERDVDLLADVIEELGAGLSAP